MKISDFDIDPEREQEEARAEGKTEYLVHCARCDKQMRLFWKTRVPQITDLFYCSDYCLKNH